MGTPERPFRLCVYCGSRNGARPAYVELAREVGHAIGQRGWQLVYGGGRAGLMGVLADAALSAGATVVGVIPDSLMRLEVGHAGLTELHVVRSMHERKQMMAERADAFLALPGGIGTFEELFEVWTWRHLDYHRRPVGLLDAEGYYQGLLGFLKRARDEGFLSPSQFEMLITGDQAATVLDKLYDMREPAGLAPPLDRI